ncbi:hypothetical protein BDA96_03G326700 [Sorghum bicolor]|uniref:Uncharacterized protein n=1 Tax=Sorghum bicolor TaxID=4558 RepID=A0A921RFL0_SORBI|nr:hypothetical protein BDA96_03G326700 [Sorghum bicolor]
MTQRSSPSVSGARHLFACALAPHRTAMAVGQWGWGSAPYGKGEAEAGPERTRRRRETAEANARRTRPPARRQRQVAMRAGVREGRDMNSGSSFLDLVRAPPRRMSWPALSHPTSTAPTEGRATTVSPCPFLPDARPPSWRGGAADASRRRIGRGGHDTLPLAVALADPYARAQSADAAPRIPPEGFGPRLVSCCLGEALAFECPAHTPAAAQSTSPGDGAAGQRPRRPREDGGLQGEKARVRR